ncbi:MAG: hypothetical protein HY899_14130 [Deltaproteobacteria bacterium]|nr:hypothetical protein [Deltaproteobacteria bacterium]
MRTVSVGLLILLFAATTANAAGLGPRKASDLVMITASNTDCPFGGEAIDLRFAADGTTSALVIPAGQALVVQSVQWRTFGIVAYEHIELLLSLQTATGVATAVAGDGSISDSLGGNAGSIQITPGVIVRPGQTLCTTCTSAFSSQTVQCLGTAQGFLTKDK